MAHVFLNVTNPKYWDIFKCSGTPPVFPYQFTKGNNFCDFLSVPWTDEWMDDLRFYIFQEYFSYIRINMAHVFLNVTNPKYWDIFKCSGTPPVFPHQFTKGNNFCDFLSVPWTDEWMDDLRFYIFQEYFSYIRINMAIVFLNVTNPKYWDIFKCLGTPPVFPHQFTNGNNFVTLYLFPGQMDGWMTCDFTPFKSISVISG